MLKLSLSLGIALGIVACGTEKSHQRTNQSPSQNVSKESSVLEQKVREAAPKRLIARIKISDLKSNDLSKMAFIPVADDSVDAKENLEGLGLVSESLPESKFLLVKHGEKPNASEGLGLCGGARCGGGCVGGGGCGGCGGGCGGGYVMGWAGGLIWGAGQIIGSILHGIGDMFMHYRPWFQGAGGFCGYNYGGQWQQGGYQYYQYDQGDFWNPGQPLPNQPLPNQPLPNQPIYQPNHPVQPSQPIYQPPQVPNQQINNQVPFTYPNVGNPNDQPIGQQPNQIGQQPIGPYQQPGAGGYPNYPNYPVPGGQFQQGPNPGWEPGQNL